MFFLVSLHSSAQVQSFIRSYGIDGFNYGQRIEVLSDTTYMLMGNKSGMFAMNNIYMIHVDSVGNIIKDRVFGENDLYYAWDMTVQGDTLFIITGYVFSDFTEEYDVFVMWIDRELNLVHTSFYQAPGWDFGRAVSVGSAGQTYVLAETFSFGPKPGLLLLDFHPDGSLSKQLLIEHPSADIQSYAMILADDSLLFLAGSLSEVDSLQKGMVLKIDTAFNILDTLLLTKDSIDVHFTGIDRLLSGLFVLSSDIYERNNDVRNFVHVTFNTDMNITSENWGLTANNYCNCVRSSWFNNYSVMGCHNNLHGAGGSDFSFSLFDGGSYVKSSTIGGINNEEPLDAAFALDSTVVLIGTTQSFGDPIRSIMFAKTCRDYMYCVSDQQHITNVNPDVEINSSHSLLVYPNPVSEILYLLFNNQNIFANNLLQIYSIDGKLVYSEILPQGTILHSIDVSQLKDGIHILLFQSEDVILRTKFSKISTL